MVNKWDDAEHYLPSDKKRFRKQRKIASAADRSKYKKSDQDKKKHPKPPKGDFLSGRIIAIKSQEIVVDAGKGGQFLCTLKGIFKKERTRASNLAVAGDKVLFEEISPGAGVIVFIEERTSFLSRSDSTIKHREHLLAANIDLVIITASIHIPPLKPGLIDRYIISTRKGGMEPLVVFNKIDFLHESDEEKELCLQCESMYSAIDIPTIRLSAETGEGIDALKGAMKDKASVFVGHSGVGKSSLINLITGLSLPIGDTGKAKKGIHTTTRACLVPLDCGGWCIDTPGIRSFGVWDLKKEELLQYYPEISEIGAGCKYPNCTHVHEPGCAVLPAVEDGRISSLRFSSFISLAEEIEAGEHKRY